MVKGNINDSELVRSLTSEVDVIVNFAAESHVDNSIGHITPFLSSNILGVVTLLEAARDAQTPKFIQISTDEVYGSILEGSFSEMDPLLPRNPYSASKASAENFCLAFANTYGMDIRITRTCNNYGPFQQLKKFIPNSINSLLTGKKISVYGNGLQEREWLHVSDNCRAINLVVENGSPNQIYNIGSEFHLKNLELANMLVELSNREDDCIVFVKDRPGHDQRYSVDSSKIRDELGWKPEIDFKSGITQTFEWYESKRREAR